MGLAPLKKRKFTEEELQPQEEEFTLGALDVLPPEIMLLILSFIPTTALLSSSNVSKTWRLLVRDFVFLTEGVFAGSKITEEMLIETLKRQCSIVNLNISVCSEISGLGIIKAVHICRKLRKLTLYGCRCFKQHGAKIMHAIAINCPELQELDLSYTNVFPDDLEAISKMSNLKVLDLSEHSNHWVPRTITSESLTSLCMSHVPTWEGNALTLNCPRLTHLDVSRSRITDQGVTGLCSQLPGLLHFNLRRTKITHMAFAELRRLCLFLKTLDIRECWQFEASNLNDLALQEIAKHIREVKDCMVKLDAHVITRLQSIVIRQDK